MSHDLITALRFDSGTAVRVALLDAVSLTAVRSRVVSCCWLRVDHFLCGEVNGLGAALLRDARDVRGARRWGLTLEREGGILRKERPLLH